MQRAMLIRAGVPAVGLLAAFAALADSVLAAVATLGVALIACMAVWWAATFPERHAIKAERAWTMWMLYPSLAALFATVLARYVWPIWAVVALVVIAMPTFAVHAMFMGQRDRTGAAPHGPLTQIVAWLPVVPAYGVLLVLLAAGVVEFVR